MRNLEGRQKLIKELVAVLVDCDTTADELYVLSLYAIGPLRAELGVAVANMDEWTEFAEGLDARPVSPPLPRGSDSHPGGPLMDYDDIQGHDPEPVACSACGEQLDDYNTCPDGHPIWCGRAIEDGDICIDHNGRKYLATRTRSGWALLGESGKVDLSHATAIVVSMWQDHTLARSANNVIRLQAAALEASAEEIRSLRRRIEQ